jgi:hypothetical protein
LPKLLEKNGGAMRVARFAVLVSVLCAALPALTFAQMEPDQIDAGFFANATPHTGLHNLSAGGVLGTRSSGSLLGIDSVANWSSYFYQPGIAFSAFGVGIQFTWQYTMVGHAPFGRGEDDDWEGETTRINAPIVPVIVDLRNFDGSPRFVNGHRLISDPAQYVTPALKSPVFAKHFYSSSASATQFTDAIQRAEFFNKADSDWHTLLRPSVKTARTMVFIRGTYRFALNNDGSCCAAIIVDGGAFSNQLFPAVPTDTTTVMGAAENAGDIHTRDISTFLFPSTYLATVTPTTVTGCCTLGFHSYDLEPGDITNGFRERRYVMDYAAWIGAPFFNAPFLDVTGLSHEMSELFNDPFVGNATPIWLAPNGLCQNNLETGDVIEGLPNMDFPITMNGFTYHPQNEALLQWFASETPSSAISGAYSYPDTTVLPSASVSLQTDCATPFTFPAKQ